MELRKEIEDVIKFEIYKSKMAPQICQLVKERLEKISMLPPDKVYFALSELTIELSGRE